MIQLHTCVSVHCDQCGDALGSPAHTGALPHRKRRDWTRPPPRDGGLARVGGGGARRARQR